MSKMPTSPKKEILPAQKAMIREYLKRFKEIPVLTYHRVTEAPVKDLKTQLFITRDELDRHLTSLGRRGYQTTTFKDLLEGATVPRPIFLTFDDGFEDNYTNLLPLLEKHKAKAVIFAIGNPDLRHNLWERPKGKKPPLIPLMNEGQLKSFHESGLVEIGSHTLTHPRLPKLNDADLDHELRFSKQYLENLLGTEVVSFSYPFGDYGQREVDRVRAAGYQFGIGTSSGPMYMGDDLYRIRRNHMSSGMSRYEFWLKTSGFYRRLRWWTRPSKRRS